MTKQRIQELRGLSIDTSHVNSNALSECLDAIEVLQAGLVTDEMRHALCNLRITKLSDSNKTFRALIEETFHQLENLSSSDCYCEDEGSDPNCLYHNDWIKRAREAME